MDRERVVFTWAHISDIHFGHGQVGTQLDQKLVLEKLLQDVGDYHSKKFPKPDVVFLTGDLAFSGTEYEEADTFLRKLMDIVNINHSDIFVIPGNHDIDLSVDENDRNIRRLVDSVRKGEESIDSVLSNRGDLDLLKRRMAAFLKFSNKYAPACITDEIDQLYWSFLYSKTDMPLRFIGLNTSMVSKKGKDKGSLSVGNSQLMDLLPAGNGKECFTIVLSHHPFDWLADGENVENWINSNSNIQLFGHLHETKSSRLVSGGGGDYLRVHAGATHSHDGVPSHCYNIGSLIEDAEGAKFKIRIWPRVWSDRNKDFRLDVENVQDGSTFAEHSVDFRYEKKDKIIKVPINYCPLRDSCGAVDVTSNARRYATCDSPPVSLAWVGREAELDLLRDPELKVITVTGIGGQGKSALAARHVDYLIASGNKDFWDWRDCREEGDTLQTHIIRIVERLSGGEISGKILAEEGFEAVTNIFFELISNFRGVFIFDNIDHYIDTETNLPILGMKCLIDGVLSKRHKSRFIFTCRPKVSYENPFFYNLTLSGLSVAETHKLFELRGVSLDNHQIRRNVTDLHSLTKGHPLWLDLIATQVAKDSSKFSFLLEDLRKSLDAGLPTTTLKSIWKTLSDHQRILLRYMAEIVRPEGEDQLANYLSREMSRKRFFKILRSLKDLALIVVKSAPNMKDTLELHPVIKSFIVNEFTKSERQKYIDVIAKFFDNVIEKLIKSVAGGAPFGVLENWILRAELAINAGNYLDALRYFSQVAEPLLSSGFYTEFIRIGNKIFEDLDFSQAILNEYPYFDESLDDLMEVLSQQGRYAEAEKFLNNYANNIVGKSSRYINLCNMKCYFYWCRKEYDQAVDWGGRGVDIKKRADLDTSFDCQHNLALALRDNGDVDLALNYFLHGHAIDEVISFQAEINRGGNFYGNIGRCLYLKDEIDRAIICFVRSSQLLEYEDNKTSVMNRGWAAFWLGEALEKRMAFDIAYAFFRRSEIFWKPSSPPKARVAQERILSLAKSVPESTVQRFSDDEHVHSFCRNWQKEYRPTQAISTPLGGNMATGTI